MIAENPPVGAPIVIVTAVGAAEGSRPAAAGLACADADVDRATLFIDVGGKAPRPTLIASAAARALEERLVAHLPTARVAARGQVCHLTVAAGPEGIETAAAALTVVRGSLGVLHVPAPLLQALLDGALGARLTAVLLRADVVADRALLALVVRDLRRRGLTTAVLKRRLAWVAERRALFGTLAPGAAGGLPEALIERLLELERPSSGKARRGSAPSAVAEDRVPA